MTDGDLDEGGSLNSMGSDSIADPFSVDIIHPATVQTEDDLVRPDFRN